MSNTLHEIEQYAWRQAHLMVNPASDRDDAVQEAMLAVWRAGDRSTSYLQGVVFKRIAGFATSRRHTGSEQPVGSKAVDVLRKRVWFDPRAAGLPDHEVDQMFGSEPPVDTHDPIEREQVRSAVAALPPRHRDLVFRRFWLGEVGTSSEHNKWRMTIRPKLRTALSPH